MTRMSPVNSSQQKKDKADQAKRFLDRLGQYLQQILAKQAAEVLKEWQPATRYIN